jgi:catechol 2,3-dioxygenase-like lactoylglutathione lyase family enzyme
VGINDVFAGVAVADYPAALEWYERLFGSPPDMFPNDTEAVGRLGEAWVYVVTDPERAGKALLTVIVDDLDERVTTLRERGLEPSEFETIPGAVRKSEITDPEGNRITFGQPLADRG